MQRVFGETYGEWSPLGRDFSHRAGEDDGGIDAEGRWRRRTRTMFDGRRSDSDEGRLEILGPPP